MENKELLTRRNKIIYSIIGVVKKAGDGWIYIEQDFKSETVSETKYNEEGEEYLNEYLKLPWNLLICYPRDDKHEFKLNGKYTFNVTINLDWDKKTKRVINRHWLINAKPISPIKKVFKQPKETEETQEAANQNPNDLSEINLDDLVGEKKMTPGTPKRRYQ